ncbi:MAG: hypothetical protein EOM50_08105 [Erysipelotrichia bacterium]|nr:hypothetical protein [Erysipelotrichia bacterium]NCC55258.1 hypothetical protein [Erysipelotrichia bacterium]
MKVYNTKHLNNKQRFPIAIIAGLISAILCGLLFAIIEIILPLHIPLLYAAMAYGVSYAVKTYGRGVQTKFTVVGIVASILSIVFGYAFIYFISMGGETILSLPTYLEMVFASMLRLNVHGIIELLCVAYAIYIAYYNSRII